MSGGRSSYKSDYILANFKKINGGFSSLKILLNTKTIFHTNLDAKRVYAPLWLELNVRVSMEIIFLEKLIRLPNRWRNVQNKSGSIFRLTASQTVIFVKERRAVITFCEIGDRGTS